MLVQRSDAVLKELVTAELTKPRVAQPDRGDLLPPHVSYQVLIQPNRFSVVVPLTVGITEIQRLERQAEDNQAIPYLPQRLGPVEQVDADRLAVDGDGDPGSPLGVRQVSAEPFHDLRTAADRIGEVPFRRTSPRRLVLRRDEPPDGDLPVRSAMPVSRSRVSAIAIWQPVFIAVPRTILPGVLASHRRSRTGLVSFVPMA